MNVIQQKFKCKDSLLIDFVFVNTDCSAETILVQCLKILSLCVLDLNTRIKASLTSGFLSFAPKSCLRYHGVFGCSQFISPL